MLKPFWKGTQAIWYATAMTVTTSWRMSPAAAAGLMREESFMNPYPQMKKSEKYPEPMKVLKESTNCLLSKWNTPKSARKNDIHNGRNSPKILRMAWNGKSFTGNRSCQIGSVCTKWEKLSICFPWRSADSDKQQLSRKSGKTFCCWQKKPAVLHLSERSRRKCNCLLNHQHGTGKRHWCQRISDNHLLHRRKTTAAEIRINIYRGNLNKTPPENIALLREKFLRGLILFAGTRGYFGVTKDRADELWFYSQLHRLWFYVFNFLVSVTICSLTDSL